MLWGALAGNRRYSGQGHPATKADITEKNGVKVTLKKEKRKFINIYKQLKRVKLPYFLRIF